MDLKKLDKDRIGDFAKDYLDNLKRKKERVSSDKYLNWLMCFIKEQIDITQSQYIYISDDMYDYNDSVSNEVKDNLSLLSYFKGYLIEKAEKQNIYFDIFNEDEQICYFYFDNHYYSMTTIFGQGSLTYIETCKERPRKYVVLSDKKAELVQYILVNADLGMSVGKTAVQVGHACTLCAVAEGQTTRFTEWLQNGQKKIVLKVHQKDIDKISKYGLYVVSDFGLTEVPSGSLTAVSLGVTTKEEVWEKIKRFQLL